MRRLCDRFGADWRIADVAVVTPCTQQTHGVHEEYRPLGEGHRCCVKITLLPHAWEAAARVQLGVTEQSARKYIVLVLVHHPAAAVTRFSMRVSWDDAYRLSTLHVDTERLLDTFAGDRTLVCDMILALSRHTRRTAVATHGIVLEHRIDFTDGAVDVMDRVARLMTASHVMRLDAHTVRMIRFSRSSHRVTL